MEFRPVTIIDILNIFYCDQNLTNPQRYGETLYTETESDDSDVETNSDMDFIDDSDLSPRCECTHLNGATFSKNKNLRYFNITVLCL